MLRVWSNLSSLYSYLIGKCLGGALLNIGLNIISGNKKTISLDVQYTVHHKINVKADFKQRYYL